MESRKVIPVRPGPAYPLRGATPGESLGPASDRSMPRAPLSGKAVAGRVRLVTAVAAAFGLSLPGSTPANIVDASLCGDTAGKGGYTLRIAVNHAASNDTVNLDALPLSCSTITLASALLIPQDTLVIRRDTAKPVTVQVGSADRVVLHSGLGTLSLIGLQLTGGQVPESGGCVFSSGSVYLSGSSVSGCHGADKGGGVYVANNLTVRGGSLSGNVVDAHDYCRGGGAYVGGHAELAAATISANTATGFAGLPGFGGGLFIGSGDIDQSTVSGNLAARAGAIEARGDFGLFRSTVSGNSAAASGGIRLDGSRFVIEASTIAFNHTTTADAAGCDEAGGLCAFVSIAGDASLLNGTIIAGNDSAATGAAADLFATQPYNGSNNLIVSANLAPADTIGADPQLAALADNGGGTQTHALAATSPAINASKSFSMTTDQRGLPRVSGSAADIGSFEFQGQGDRIFLGRFE